MAYLLVTVFMPKDAYDNICYLNVFAVHSRFVSSPTLSGILASRAKSIGRYCSVSEGDEQE